MPSDQLLDVFRTRLEARGATVVPLGADLVRVTIGERNGEMYLDNARRRVEAGEPLEVLLSEFVDVAVSRPSQPSSTPEFCAGLRLLLERCELVDSDRDLSRAISPEVARLSPG